MAECEDGIAGFVCGSYRKSFDPRLANQYGQARHHGVWAKFTLKYLFGLYDRSSAFEEEFKVFFDRMGAVRAAELGDCDCELTALSSRKDYRGGLGRGLVDKFMERCQGDGAKSVRLFTDSFASYSFYDNYGFDLVKKIPYIKKSEKESCGNIMVYEYYGRKIRGVRCGSPESEEK